jgi:hypothetical protein
LAHKTHQPVREKAEERGETMIHSAEKRAIRRCAGQRLEKRRVSLDPKDSSARPNARLKIEAQRIEVFVNKENEERISNELLGTGTQIPSPFPDHFSC